MRRLALLAATAALAACQPRAPNDAAPVTQADTAVVPASAPDAPPVSAPVTPTPASLPALPPKAERDYRAALRLTGTEPFWGVQIGDKIVLQRPDHPDLVVANAGPEISVATATWNARGLKIVLDPADCSDGMSDNRYPYTATVTVGSEVLKGCAAPANDWPRPH